jgi:hypothetical protein
MGCLECSNGLVVRGSPHPLGSGNRWQSGYGFYVNRHGQYGVFKYTNGDASVLQNWTDSPAINTGEQENTLRVVASGSNFHFSVNNTLVWYGSDTSYSAGRVGLAMYRTSASVDDQFSVDWATLVPINSFGVTTSHPMDLLSQQQIDLNIKAKRREFGDDRYGP